MKTFIQYTKSLEEIKKPNMLIPGLMAMSLGLGVPSFSAQAATTQKITQTSTSTTAWKEIISKFEGFRTSAYWDATGKIWTIGKGSTTHPDGRPVRQGDKITKQQADAYMEHYVNTKILPKLKNIPNWNLMNSNQKAALISFAYNVGPGFYGKEGFESITRALKTPSNWSQVPSALSKYIRSDGKVLPGLIKRRNAEGTLWTTPN